MDNKKVSVLWFPNYACNLRCDYCWNHGKFHITENEKFDTIINNLVNGPIKYCTIAGGEPLLIPRIFYAIEQLETHNIKTRVFTNASLHKKLKDLAETKPFEIIVSLDSIERNVNNIGRQKTEKVIKGISLLKAMICKKTNLTLYICITPKTIDTLGETLEWAHEMGIDAVQLSFIHDNKDNVVDRSKHQINSIGLDKQIDSIKQVLSKFDFKNNNSTLNYFELLRNALVKDQLPKNHCGATKLIVNVRPSGEIFVCPHRNLKIGDLTVESFADSLYKWYDMLKLNDLNVCKSTSCLHMFKEFTR